MAIMTSALGPSAISGRNVISGDRSLRSLRKADALSSCDLPPAREQTLDG
jgi:hypothetical protein